MSKKATTLPDLLKILWQEGFFEKAKELSEISGGLAAKRYNFLDSILGVALLRSVKHGGILTRFKQAGKWKYIQKHPTDSIQGQRTDIFSRYDLHPKIKEVSWGQFEGGHFKEAIQNAFVEVIDQVKIKTNHPKSSRGKELDGDELMFNVFDCDNNKTPKIKLNKLKTSLDEAEQRGIMYLFKGIVGIRDRKAHLNFIQNDPLKTIEYLSLASLLMRLLDEH